MIGTSALLLNPAYVTRGDAWRGREVGEDDAGCTCSEHVKARAIYAWISRK
jgi:hypothetical protein